MIWLFAVLGAVLAYACWQVLFSIWSRLQELGIENTKSSSNYFDNLLYGLLSGLAVARLVWMFFNRALYIDVPFGLLPYNRSATEIVWFAVFPWRIFRVDEGVYFPVLWGIMGVYLIWTLFLPTIRLIRRLKLEKRGIMRAFLVKVLLCGLLAGGYFALIIYFSL